MIQVVVEFLRDWRVRRRICCENDSDEGVGGMTFVWFCRERIVVREEVLC
jgi:hypothetical protein